MRERGCEEGRKGERRRKRMGIRRKGGVELGLLLPTTAKDEWNKLRVKIGVYRRDSRAELVLKAN